MYVYDPMSGVPHPNGACTYYTPGAYRSLARITCCPCDDNVRRLAYITGQPHDAFSVPAAVRVRGKWVSGFISWDNGFSSHEDGPGLDGPRFHVVTYGKNHALIPDAGKLARALTEGR
jgi:hypothetical protein